MKIDGALFILIESDFNRLKEYINKLKQENKTTELATVRQVLEFLHLDQAFVEHE